MEPAPEPRPDPSIPAGRAERKNQLQGWAFEAERATGRRERSDADVRRNVWLRVAVIGAGSLLTVAGLAMMVLPGPGIVVVIAGLGLLAREVSWAERLLAYAKRKAKVDRIADQAPWVKPVALAMTVIGVGVSIIYAVRWR